MDNLSPMQVAFFHFAQTEANNVLVKYGNEYLQQLMVDNLSDYLRMRGDDSFDDLPYNHYNPDINSGGVNGFYQSIATTWEGHEDNNWDAYTDRMKKFRAITLAVGIIGANAVKVIDHGSINRGFWTEEELSIISDFGLDDTFNSEIYSIDIKDELPIDMDLTSYDPALVSYYSCLEFYLHLGGRQGLKNLYSFFSGEETLSTNIPYTKSR
jgi:hypothetical protein